MRRLVVCTLALITLGTAGVAQAGTLSFAGGVVTYEASPGETNHVFLISDSGGVVAIDLGAAVTAGTGCASVNASAASCGSVPLGSDVEVLADDMNDYVNTVALEGFYENRIDGGDGNDDLNSGSTYSVLDGGPGSDTFHSVGGTVDYSGRTNPVTVTVGDYLANDGEAGENDLIPSTVGRVTGGHGNDHLSGGEVASVNFWGGPGDDVLEAESFAHLIGGHGDDRLLGGDDHQFMDGGPGDDLLRGGPNGDSLVGGLGTDGFNAGAGNDTLRSRDGVKDYVNGASGFDRGHVDRRLDVVRSIEELF